MGGGSSNGNNGGRRDTPRDLPAVHRGVELTARGSLETLESAYALWAEARARHAAVQLRYAEERRRLDDEASFMVGAVRAANVPAAPSNAPDEGGLTAPSELSRFVDEAETRIAEARARLEARISEEEGAFARQFTELLTLIRDRLARIAASSRPALRMVPRRLAGDRRIVHVDRVSPDEAIVLLHVFAGKLPSRYGFLLDDSTDDVSLPPPPLYPDEGVRPDELRPEARRLSERARGAGEMVPIKGFLPMPVALPEGGEAFYRLLQRGPVMELELLDGDAFRNILSREEAERAAGHLIRLKLAGRIELTLAAE